MNAPNPNFAWAGALFEELARSGVRHACVCPGSRSSVLAIAAAETPDVRVWTHIDERSAAFFALGLAKASRAPVALVCTSGTAAANFLPAVVEACFARVPLVVLTADRPPELRGVGAPQTIDQLRLFGSHVRWFAEAPLPDAGDAALRHARALACRAVAEADGAMPGPVHLNLPFREPLDPRAVAMPAAAPLARDGRAPQPYTAVVRAPAEPSAETLAFVAELVRAHPRGAIAAGPSDLADDAVEALAALAEAAGWPLLAEPAAQLRSGAPATCPALVSHADWLLRDAGFAETHAPDVVLRVGPMPTSKSFRLWLERAPAPHSLVVDPGGGWEDPSHLASAILRVDPARLAERVLRQVEGRVARVDAAWLASWRAADDAAGAVIGAARAQARELTTPALVAELQAALPDGALLYAANSMAIRDLDAFWAPSERRVRVLANRGANGIDGLVSSALGAAAATGRPVALLTGDLAFLHDVGALVAAHRHRLSLTIAVVDDDGGGIFSLLPIAAHGARAHFDELFRMPHGLDLARVAAGFGARAVRVANRSSLRAELSRAAALPGVHLLAIPLDRARDLELRASLAQDLRAALGRLADAA